MIQKKRLLSLLALTVATIFFASCSKDDVTEPVKANSISLQNTLDILYEGQFHTLSVKVSPADAEDYTLVFSSSQPTVASVSSTGKLSALSSGQSEIVVSVKENPAIRAAFTLTVQAFHKAPENTLFRKVAYYPSYRNLTEAGIPTDKLKMVDVACFAFAEINPDFSLTVQMPDKLSALAARCKIAGVKIVISFTGKHSTFAAMCSSPQNRAKFIHSLKDIVNRYGLDGVDNDWEFPRTTDGSDKGNTVLMKELSSWLHDPGVNKLLTMSISSGQYEGGVAGAIEKECFDYVDWFNIMCYDSYLGWGTQGDNPNHMAIMEIAYNYWVGKRSLPKSKFVGGIGAYGRPSEESLNGIPVSFAEILRQGGNADSFKASVTSPSYDEGKTPLTVYYNGRPFVKKKTRYCIDRKLGGIMFWEAGQDIQDDRSLIKAAYDEVGNYKNL